MDVVSVLRSENRAGRLKQVVKDPKYNILKFGNNGEQACKCNDATNFISHNTGGGYYSIESIWFLLTKKDKSHGPYILEAKKAGLGETIQRVDRAFILAYMAGDDTENKERLDSSAYVPLVQRTSELEISSSPVQQVADELQPDTKRPRLDQGDKPRKVDQSDLTKKIMSREVVYDDRLSVLRGNKSFDHVLLYLNTKPKSHQKAESKDQPGSGQRQKPIAYDRYNQQIKQTQGEMFGIQEDSFVEEQHHTDQPQSTATRQTPTPKKKTHKLVPIIVVPSGMKDMITLHNIRSYLEDGKFLTNQSDHFNKPSNVIVERKRNGVTVPYKVIDNVNGMTKDQWERVIACFVAGPEWQFKRWPWYEESGSAGVFSRIRGFYVNFDDQPEHPNIKKWDITKLQISRTKRHLDKTSSLRFWDALDRFSSKFTNYLRL
eukprot:m.260304 g.260304  ORF g.260304 m.260304 type:complete len:432 (+) comp39648_c0_seq1:149-1444(+)